MTGKLTLPCRTALAVALSGVVVIAPVLAVAAPGPARAATAAPWPVTLTIRTIPALPDVRFELDGVALTSGPDGTAAHTGQHNFSQHTLRLLDSTIVRQDRQYRFTRWAGQRDPDQAFRATVSGLPMRADYAITAAFSVWCPVTPRFTDQHGRVLDPAQIAQVTVRSDTGQPVTFGRPGRPGSSAPGPFPGTAHCAAKTCSTRCRAPWCPAPTSVHAGIQRFRPTRTRAPTIVGYFHDLTITAHDALFGGGTGQEALVTLPDHRVVAEPFGPGHAATLSNLPQGSYQVRVKAGGAMSPPRRCGCPGT